MRKERSERWTTRRKQPTKTPDRDGHEFWTASRGGRDERSSSPPGLVGMALILASEFWPGQRPPVRPPKPRAEDFLEKTEAKLADVVGSIQGAGKCRIMVTLENGVEYVYATQQKVNTDRQEGTDGNSSKLNQRDDTEESIVIVETENGRGRGCWVTELQPTVKGVVIVCEGGDQPLVQQRVTDAVTIALNISSKRVCVTKLTE